MSRTTLCVAQDARSAHQLERGPLVPGRPPRITCRSWSCPEAITSGGSWSKTGSKAPEQTVLLAGDVLVGDPHLPGEGIERTDERQRHPHPGLPVPEREDVIVQGEVAAVVAAGLHRVMGDDDGVPLALVAQRAGERIVDLLVGPGGAGGRVAIGLHVVVEPPFGVEGDEPDVGAEVHHVRPGTPVRRSEPHVRPAELPDQRVLPANGVPAVAALAVPVVIAGDQQALGTPFRIASTWAATRRSASSRVGCSSGGTPRG